ncbi:hypothetical protein [uncultured Cohaesibacter sp.]|uniref:hypothetical protein n=1 Tax=uncultured Cohaesibacter sp. TaxID=1002546 RepID=UPI002AA959AD|nr:hypothetical protein [uncultured Cohaesibacter sp.]
MDNNQTNNAAVGEMIRFHAATMAKLPCHVNRSFCELWWIYSGLSDTDKNADTTKAIKFSESFVSIHLRIGQLPSAPKSEFENDLQFSSEST